MNGSPLDWRLVLSGVPQGLVSGTLLLFIFLCSCSSTSLHNIKQTEFWDLSTRHLFTYIGEPS